jgi:signal peptidase II
MQLGGAIGNLLDRLRFGGSVTDLLYIRPFPVFNIADAAIVTGVGLLMFHLWRTAPKTEAQPAPINSADEMKSTGNE